MTFVFRPQTSAFFFFFFYIGCLLKNLMFVSLSCNQKNSVYMADILSKGENQAMCHSLRVCSSFLMKYALALEVHISLYFYSTGFKASLFFLSDGLVI